MEAIISDSGILASSVMGEMFDRDEMNLPSPFKIHPLSN